MSLRDTLDAARKEVEEGGSFPFGKKEKEEEAAAETSGFSKRSTAKAKPTRERAASVRVVSSEAAKSAGGGKAAADMSKEERKAARDERRAKEDLEAMARSILLKQDEEYQRTQRNWWILLGVGFAGTVVSLIINWIAQRGNFAENTQLYVIIAIGSIALAYICVIAGFVYDWRKGRPIRKRVDAQVAGMTKKRMEQLVREDAERKQAEKDAKAKK